MNRFGLAFIALAAAAAVAAPAARAQFPRGGSPTSGASTSHIKPSQPAPAARGADVPVSLTGQVQLVLDKLEDELRIGAHQQKAWDAYASRIKRYADDLTRARYSARDMQDGGLTVTQQFDRLAEIANNRMTAVEEIIEAGRALYATLGPDQRRLADKGLVLVPLRLVSGSAAGTAARTDEGPAPDPPPKRAP